MTGHDVPGLNASVPVLHVPLDWLVILDHKIPMPQKRHSWAIRAAQFQSANCNQPGPESNTFLWTVPDVKTGWRGAYRFCRFYEDMVCKQSHGQETILRSRFLQSIFYYTSL